MRWKTKDKRRQKHPCRISVRRAFGVLIALLFASSFFLVFAFHVFLSIEEHKVDHLHFRQSTKTQQKRNFQKERPDSIVQPNDGLLSKNQRLVQEYLRQTMNRTFLPLTAYLEPPLQKGKPLPRRTNIELEKYTYPRVSCQDLLNNLPVHHPTESDHLFGPNVGELSSLYPLRKEYAPLCPVDADPFLPWIHDVFPSKDGEFIEFIAHNKRRCRTSFSFSEDLRNLEPQVAIMQSVPVRRLTSLEVSQMVPDWKESTSTQNHYRLASLEEADEDGRETRFICQFHSLRPTEEGHLEKVVLGETLSVFPYNYEHANFRMSRKPHPMLTRPKDKEDTHGAHNENVWNSVFHFRCPVPKDLKIVVQSGESVVNGVPSIYLDLVPIRTPARETSEGYCPQVVPSTFDPKQEWGDTHVLPSVENSGRWSNVPICHPPANQNARANKMDYNKEKNKNGSSKYPDYLIGCLWASAAFTTRGAGAEIDTSTSLRLLEWLSYHLFIAEIDHIYVYDNTEAHTQESSLQPVLDLFPNRVTRIPWKHRVCNNNRPMHKNAGERSSQYTAEASCRVRYGPTTEWLISFDTDEYLIPQGNWSNIKEWLQESVRSGKIGDKTNILSFYQTRALPNMNHMEPFILGSLAIGNQDSKCGATIQESQCLTKREDITYLEAYDCEYTALPKPDFAWRAQKQIYRPLFVLNHFVHYSTVTRRILEAPQEASPPFIQRKPYERRVNELTESFMLHTKTTAPPATLKWKYLCRADNDKKCPVGIPFSNANQLSPGENSTKDGLAYNCYQHDRIQNDLSIKLRELLKPLRKRYQAKSNE